MPDMLPVNDPNVKIPSAVTAAAARADDIYKKAYQPEQPPVDPQNEPPADPTAPLEPPEPPAQSDPAAPPADPKTKPLEEWEHRYNSMKGRWEKSEASVRSLSEQITHLQGVIATLQQPKEPAAAPEVPKLITNEERELYGDDLLAVVGKRAREEVSNELAGMRDYIKQLEAQVKGVGTTIIQSARDKLFETLDTRCPDWRDINTNENFLAWLRLPDAFSGAIRQELLNQAFEQNNAPRVLAFFNGFLAEEAAVDPARGPDRVAAAPAAPKVPLESLAAPGRAKSAAASGAPAEKPTFTRAQIAAFYADIASGRYAGRQAEKDKLEAQIFEAQRDGRIR